MRSIQITELWARLVGVSDVIKDTERYLRILRVRRLLARRILGV